MLVIIQYSVLYLSEVGTQECSGIKGTLSKVMKSFISRGYMNPVTSTGQTSIDNGVSANLELLDKFCYLGNMMSVDRDCTAVVCEVVCCMEVRPGLCVCLSYGR